MRLEVGFRRRGLRGSRGFLGHDAGDLAGFFADFQAGEDDAVAALVQPLQPHAVVLVEADGQVVGAEAVADGVQLPLTFNAVAKLLPASAAGVNVLGAAGKDSLDPMRRRSSEIGKSKPVTG